MKTFGVFCGVFCVLGAVLLSTAAVAQPTGHTGRTGKAGATRGGSLGTGAAAPGTNTAGTAIPSGSVGVSGNPPEATNNGQALVDKADRDMNRALKNICRGC
jgi:hypothetical protein